MRAETARQVCGGPGRRGNTVGPHGRLWLASTAVARLTSVSMVAWIGWRLSATALQDAGEPTARCESPIGKLERPEGRRQQKVEPRRLTMASPGPARRSSLGDLGSDSLGFSRPRDFCPFSRFRRYRVSCGSGTAEAFDRCRENFLLGNQPVDVRRALRLTIGHPKVVGAFANCLFQIWHGILLANDVPSPGKFLLPQG